MATRLPRHLGPEHSLPCGMFTVETESRRAALSCPRCSLVFSLPAGVGIGCSGLVTHEVTCPQLSCSWRSFVELESIWEAA